MTTRRRKIAYTIKKVCETARAIYFLTSFFKEKKERLSPLCFTSLFFILNAQNRVKKGESDCNVLEWSQIQHDN